MKRRIPSRAVTIGIILLLGSSLFGSAVNAETTQTNQGEPLSDRTNAEQGLVYTNLEAGSDGVCEGLLRVSGSQLCTHGPDLPPPGVDVSVSVEPIAATPGTASPAATVPCDGDGTSGKRVEVLYVRASDVTSRYSTYLSSFQQWSKDVDTIYKQSAAETGGSRSVRFVHDANCVPVVRNVVVSPAADDDFGATIEAVLSQGFNRTDRKYVMFVEANIYCGIGNIIGDDIPGATNANNGGPSFSRVDNGCWNGPTAAHELMHNIGGVQLSAPNTSGGFHCIDEWDVMCYSDEPNHPTMEVRCSDTGHDSRLDCNHDDYYHTKPAAGSYLATHWNAANSQFLIGASAGTLDISVALSLSTLNPGVNQSVVAKFTVKNNTGSTITLQELAAGARMGSAWTGTNYDFPHVTNITLPSGQSYAYSMSRAFSVTGDYFAEPVVKINGQWGGFGAGVTRVTFKVGGGSKSPPSAPANLSATAASKTSIRLTWTDTSSNEQGFKIYRKSGSTKKLMASVKANTAAYTVSGLQTNTEYCFVVDSYNSYGVGSYPNFVCARTQGGTGAPPAPANLTATAASTTSIRLTWTDTASNEQGFKVYRQSGSSEVLVATLGANTTTYSAIGLSANTQYCFVVDSYNSSGVGAYPSYVCATTQGGNTPPTPPSNLTAVALSTTSIKLDWTDASGNEQGFKVYRQSGTSDVLVATLGANTVTYTVTGLKANTLYCFAVDSYNSYGVGAYPTYSCAKTQNTGGTLGVPTDVVATALGGGVVRVAWTDNADSETGFTIWDGARYWFIEAATGIGNGWYVDLNGGWPSGTYKCFQMAATRDGAYSEWSPYSCVTTP